VRPRISPRRRCRAQNDVHLHRPGLRVHPRDRRSRTRTTGSTYTSWAFGRRLRGAGLLGSMGSIGDCFDNSVAESFFGTLQLELLDEHHWENRHQLAQAIFEWIEAWYNPRRRHSYCQMLSPVDYEAAHAA
jgi:transposase InsO family protein